MGKTKTSSRTDNKSRQIILFEMENIIPPGILGAVHNLGIRDRNGV